MATTAASAAAIDLSVLNYALTLENLEAAFYVQALQNFSQADFLAAGLTERDYHIIVNVRDTELTHVNFLRTAISGIGATPVPPCTYNFPNTDVKSFLAIATALEKTGVSAYIGAAPMISNKAYLTAAATIVTVEARHTAFFNYITGKTPVPSAFDTPLGMRAVVSIASGFIVSCPYTLPMVFPSLTISPAVPAVGSQITVTYAGSSAGDACVFLSVTGNKVAPISDGKCTVPSDVVGDVYIVIAKVSDAMQLSDDNTKAGPASFTTPNKSDIAF